MIEFWCGKCGALFRTADDKVGRQAHCQWCGHKQVVPDPDVPPPQTIQFHCSECDVLLGVPVAYAGQRVRCNECEAVLLVPQAHAKPPRRIPGPAARAKPQRPAPRAKLLRGAKPRGGVPPKAAASPQGRPAAAPSDPPASPAPATDDIIEFRCQFCGHEFRVSRELAGRKGKCQACGAVNVVPSEQPG